MDGREVTAHCPNTGSMLGLLEEGATVWVEPNDDPKKKLKYGWRLIEQDGAKIVIDTGLANKVIGEALRAGRIEGLVGDVRAEVLYGESSRADFLVTTQEGRTWVEVKSVTLSRQTGLAEFPDAPTVRGAKHLNTLAAQVAQGDRAVMIYALMRDDCTTFSLAADIDPNYAKIAEEAAKSGVSTLCLATSISAESITFGRLLQNC